jgi:hypothetical protein
VVLGTILFLQFGPQHIRQSKHELEGRKILDELTASVGSILYLANFNQIQTLGNACRVRGELCHYIEASEYRQVGFGT